MKYLLDTNICIFALKTPSPALRQKLRATTPADIAVSAITAAELRFGADNSSRKKENHRILDNFLDNFAVLTFDEPATRAYGEIRAVLRRKGKPVGPLDTLIAAHAISANLTLVTNNTRELRRVPGLSVEDWSR